jgi:hypothetical protein
MGTGLGAADSVNWWRLGSVSAPGDGPAPQNSGSRGYWGKKLLGRDSGEQAGSRNSLCAYSKRGPVLKTKRHTEEQSDMYMTSLHAPCTQGGRHIIFIIYVRTQRLIEVK